MSTDVTVLQELTAQENTAAQKRTICCITYTIPGCQLSFVSA
jgi:hypothetical protein